jgi:hypothetical protein
MEPTTDLWAVAVSLAYVLSRWFPRVMVLKLSSSRLCGCGGVCLVAIKRLSFLSPRHAPRAQVSRVLGQMLSISPASRALHMGNKLRQLAQIGREANARRAWATSDIKKDYKFDDSRKAMSQEQMYDELNKQAAPDESYLDNLSKLMKSASIEARPAPGAMPQRVVNIAKNTNKPVEALPGMNAELVDQMEHVTPKMPLNRFRVARLDKSNDNMEGKLTGDQMNAILVLYTRDPAQNTAEKLASQFNVNLDQVRVLLSSITIPRK